MRLTETAGAGPPPSSREPMVQRRLRSERSRVETAIAVRQAGSRAAQGQGDDAEGQQRAVGLVVADVAGAAGLDADEVECGVQLRRGRLGDVVHIAGAEEAARRRVDRRDTGVYAVDGLKR